MRALFTGLQTDVSPMAAAAGLVTFVAVQSFLKHWFRPLPNGPFCYWIRREDSAVPRLIRWILGDLPLVFLKPAGVAHATFTNAARTVLGDHRGHAAFFAGSATRVMLSNPDDVRHVFFTAAEHVEKAKLMRFLEPILGRYSLVALCDEHVHTAQFRHVSHAFGTANIKNMAATTMREHLTDMVATLSAKVAHEGPGTKAILELYFDEAGLEIISEAAFRTKQFAALRSLIKESLSAPNPLMMIAPRLFARLPLPRNLKLRRLRKVIAAPVAGIVNQVRDEKRLSPAASSSASDTSSSSMSNVESSSDDDHARGPIFTTPAVVREKKLIDLLAENDALTDEMILDHTITFVLAGYETTANAMNWIIYHVARSKHVQDTLFEELSAAFALGVTPSVNSVANLPYLRAVCDESLRCVPPVSAVNRETTEEMVLPSGTYLPKGTTVVASPLVLHTDAEVWGEDANEFRPERWIEEPNLKQRVSPCSYVPFALGKRACIGKEFAVLEMMLGVAMLFRTFEIGWPSDEPEAVCRSGIVTRPKKRFNVHLTLRAE